MTIERAIAPDLKKLLADNASLSAEFRRLQETFPGSKVFGPVVGRPLNMTWHPLAGETNLSPDIAAGVEWTSRLRRYLGALQRCFVDWLDRPDKLTRFGLIEWAQGVEFTDWETITSDLCLAILEHQRQLLLIELTKQGQQAPLVKKPGGHAELRTWLGKLIPKTDKDIGALAKEIDIDRDTLADFVNGKILHPHRETVRKIRNFKKQYHRSS